MSHCYYCANLLTTENDSREHLIPNAIGGVLSVKGLLCNKCNNSLGQLIDAPFASRTHFFMHHLGLDRQIGKVPDYTVTSAITKKEYVLNSKSHNGKIRINSKPQVHPMFDDVGKLIKINIDGEFMDESHLRQFLLGIKRQEIYSQINIDKIVSQAQYNTIAPHTDVLKVELGSMLGGEELYCGILKIAINYYLYSGGSIQYLSNAISALKCQNTEGYINAAFIDETQNVYLPSKNEVSHVILIRGCHKEQILYVYIEIFNLPYIVLLSKEYNGENILVSYTLDLSTKQANSDITVPNWSRQQLTSIITSYGFNPTIVQQKLSRIFELVKIRSNKLCRTINKNENNEKI